MFLWPHSLIAVESTLKGLGKLIVDPATIAADLDGCWSVLAEAIQTILRREGYPQPYEALKQLTRTNEAIDSNSIREFIDSLQEFPRMSAPNCTASPPRDMWAMPPESDSERDIFYRSHSRR